MKQSIRIRKVAKRKLTDTAIVDKAAADAKEDAKIKEILFGLKFLKVKPRKVFTFDMEFVKTAGVSWSFARSNGAYALLPSAEDLAKEIKLLNSLYSWSTFRVEFGESLEKLDETQLNSLLLADHNFNKSIISNQGCNEDTVRVLTWMRTKAGFSYRGDTRGNTRSDGKTYNRNWDNKKILEPMWHWSQAGQEQHLEKAIDLIFDDRYWTCMEDDIKFPLRFVHDIAFWKQRKHVLQWFLERGQYRYPIQQFTLNDRQKFAKLVKSLSERGDAEFVRETFSIYRREFRTLVSFTSSASFYSFETLKRKSKSKKFIRQKSFKSLVLINSLSPRTNFQTHQFSVEKTFRHEIVLSRKVLSTPPREIINELVRSKSFERRADRFILKKNSSYTIVGCVVHRNVSRREIFFFCQTI